MGGARHQRRGGTGKGPASEIPDKLYFKIGEVADLVGVQPHVLRYWEKEIPLVRPTKTASNQRRYRRRDVEQFREIRRLLHNERFTLAGAKRRLSGTGERTNPVEAASSPGASTARMVPPDTAPNQLALGFSSLEQREKLERVRKGLRELIRLSGEEPPDEVDKE